MFKSFIVSAILGAAAFGGGQYYVTGAVPFLDAPTQAPVAYAAPAPAQAAVSAPVAAPAPCTAPLAPAPSQGAPTPAPAPASTAGLVNVNTATASELEALPGIGAKTADRIVGMVKSGHRFTSVDELAKLPGVTSTNYALFAGKVTV